ncbi:hypothetical protein NVP1170O_027 [Vibrio phage 1.170.O._10N.261.52.C3]|nr:hypothetical protein NVP1170O_027 [Vibrio phage 1.170.O._10N.261.52.C3]
MFNKVEYSLDKMTLRVLSLLHKVCWGSWKRNITHNTIQLQMELSQKWGCSGEKFEA